MCIQRLAFLVDRFATFSQSCLFAVPQYLLYRGMVLQIARHQMDDSKLQLFNQKLGQQDIRRMSKMDSKSRSNVGGHHAASMSAGSHAVSISKVNAAPRDFLQQPSSVLSSMSLLAFESCPTALWANACTLSEELNMPGVAAFAHFLLGTYSLPQDGIRRFHLMLAHRHYSRFGNQYMLQLTIEALFHCSINNIQPGLCDFLGRATAFGGRLTTFQDQLTIRHASN
jgi:hypothetical protein